MPVFQNWESNAERARRKCGEKAPWTAPSASAAGMEGAYMMYATVMLDSLLPLT